MARDLKLEVMLSAVDKITAPLRSIARGGGTTAKAMKDARDQLKQLQAQQRDAQSFKALQRELDGNSQALEESRAQVTAYQGALERQRTVQQGIAAEVKVHRAAVRNLHQAMISAKEPSAELNRQYALAKDHLQKLEATYGKSNSQLNRLKKELKEAGAATEALDANGQSLSAQLTTARSKLEAAGISADRLGDEEASLTTRIEQSNAALAQHEQRLKRVTKHQQLLGKAKEQYERTQGVAGSMAGSGAAGLATGTGILYGAARMAAPQVAAEQQGALIAAQSGKGSAEAAQYAQVIRGIRAAGVGEDMASVGNAVAAVNSTLQQFGTVSAAELDSATRKAINLATAMGGDVAEHAQMAGILMQNGLAKNSNEAFDLITAGMQNVSAQMRGELPEIIQEYSTHFRGMGFSGQEAMSLLVDMAKQGKFALDKTGDAIKEFSIRGSDMSKKSVEAYEAIGLNAEQMSSAIAGGGEGARKALQQTTKGLLAIKDPAERANTAIALFGTPVEDLAVDQIPAFLQALSGSTDNLGNVAGAADKLGKTLNDNLAGDLSSLSGAWGELNATLTDGHSSALRQVTQGITETIGRVRAWAQANPALASGLVKLAVGFGMLVAAGGALTLVLASVLGPFAMVRYGLAMIGIKVLPLISLLPKIMLGVRALGGALWALAANPVVLTIAAIAAGAYLLWRNWGTLGPKFAALWTGIKATFSQTMDWFATLPARFMQFGADILTGLANGITSALGSVKTAITGAGDATVGWFKEKLGIHSPSRVFAELGGDTMAGLDQGLRKGQTNPFAALDETTKGVVQKGKEISAVNPFAGLADATSAPAKVVASNPFAGLAEATAAPAKAAASNPFADLAKATAAPAKAAASNSFTALAKAGVLAAGVGAAAMPAAAAPVAFDNRPPLAAGGAPAATAAPANITINVQAGPGMDEAALAKLVAQEVQRITSGQSARSRSALHDRD